MIILDTNIIIELFKGNTETRELLESRNEENFSISIITGMELYYGAINKRELNKIKKFLKSFNLLAINEEISRISLELIEKYSKSHGLEIPDALIAATSIYYDAPLLTYNKKDFKYIKDLKLL
ncbi:MAG TPA: type II toxin-antitoxin system VapC family toxin [Persephonella sp.]|uniref:Ribonuclease VapC n=1 Tax=Persephonella marina (strain DSM 14350 / EX-H1) TaxID=123214 RepID=C0QSH9_PERMH|nr:MULTISPECIES: type II toxin-antitoxin system VapC family toxin [Persephonella]ACO03160.1 PIN domain protein [Persephonella marina EX-H1]HCB69371.1 type II toxin-antitoxin system VapC family toxin [Persephonella sp.]